VALIRSAWNDTAVTLPARALLGAIAPLRDAEIELQVRDHSSLVQITARPDPIEYRALIAPVAPEAARSGALARMGAGTA
jgi:antitoxin component of MazEF toxin-antitoxin module